MIKFVLDCKIIYIYDIDCLEEAICHYIDKEIHLFLIFIYPCIVMYYDARIYEYQIYKCQIGKRNISIQKHQKQSVQNKCSNVV
jgi:hypothetical protein